MAGGRRRCRVGPMFTGIIEAIGEIAERREQGGDLRLYIRTGKLDLSDLRRGDSVAVNGVCLTAVTLPGDGFSADVSRETLTLTSLGGLRSGDRVNLEKALTLGARLGGHLVSGHIDGLGLVVERHDDARSVRFTIEVPTELARYVAKKGSIAVDGTSLTVNAVDGRRCSLNVVPHTLKETIMAGYSIGRQVNLEVDLVARYLERLLLGDRAAESNGGSALDLELLARTGFLPE